MQQQSPTPHDPDYYTDQQAQVEYNINSLIAMPWSVCPWPAVRLALLRLAIEGAEIYAYQGASLTHIINALECDEEPQRQWIIWHRQPDPAIDARFTPRQWAEKYGYLSANSTSQEGA